MYSVLIVEDMKKIADNMAHFLEKRGYDVTVSYNGNEGLELLKTNTYDVAILDLMLPEVDGNELCEYIKTYTDTGVIMATAKNTDEDMINGLDRGADDYLGKPFQLPVLEAKIRSLLRRLQPNSLIHHGTLRINCKSHVVELDDQPVSLTTKQQELLEYLCKNQGVFLSRTDLIDHMRGGDIFSNDEKLDVYINVLRKKIGKQFIETKRGFGYRFTTSFADNG